MVRTDRVKHVLPDKRVCALDEGRPEPVSLPIPVGFTTRA